MTHSYSMYHFHHFPDHLRFPPLFSFLVVGVPLVMRPRFSSTHRALCPPAAAVELSTPLMLARSRTYISRSAESLKPELRSMGSSSSVTLADLRHHRISATLEPEVKMATKGITMIRQLSSILAPSASSPRWHYNSPFSPALRPHHAEMLQVSPITSSPPNGCRRQSSRDASERKLGLHLLGRIQFGQLCSFLWACFNSGGPSNTFSWPMSDLSCRLLNPNVFMCRHIAMNGRGLLSWLVSTLVQRMFDTSIYYTCFAGFILLLVSNFSSEKSSSISSHWERSRSSSSCLKERTVPPICLFTRGQLSSVALPRIYPNSSTALSSSVALRHKTYSDSSG